MERTDYILDFVVRLGRELLECGAKELGEKPKDRFISVPINGIHLEKLYRLSDLAEKICDEKPEPEKLEALLFKTLLVPCYSKRTTILGYLLAMSCLCFIFGGEIQVLEFQW